SIGKLSGAVSSFSYDENAGGDGGVLRIHAGSSDINLRFIGNYETSDFTLLNVGTGASIVLADQFHWQSGVSGAFEDPDKWDVGAAPQASDDARIDAAGTYSVTISSDIDINSLQMVKNT